MAPKGYPYGRPVVPPNERPPPPPPNRRSAAPPRSDDPNGRPVATPPDDDPTEIVPIDDAPTTVNEPVPDDSLLDDPGLDDPRLDDPRVDGSPAPDASAETTGTEPGRRHRRRAGQSSNERPASAYCAEAEAGSDTRTPRAGRRRRPTFWKELPLLIGVALLLTFGIQTFLAKVYVIPSGSMETTLHGCTGCVNDRVIVDKLSYRFGDPAPGDVVVFRGPTGWVNEFDVQEPGSALARGLQQFGSLIGLAPPDEKDFVKRVIAVGGQTVQCCDTRNRILVDGAALEEPYVYYLPEAGPPRQDPFGPIQVPEGRLWMMGDSRNNSADSRVPGQGAVPLENVIGQARLIVLPFNRFSGIEAINPQAVAVGPGPTDRDVGAPLALGLLGALPLALGRRRSVGSEVDSFLPSTRRRS
ncbi:MAG: signal peptidase I [Pseudonocardia sp.]